jgi:GNAT superfamily N-acetyltransferase
MNEIIIEKPKTDDLPGVKAVLAQWTESSEVDKYVKRIEDEITGKVEFNTRYWAAKESSLVIGVTGLCDPLPKVLPFAKTDRPGELKILYVAGEHQGKGVGRKIVDFLENEARKEGYKELFARSAAVYRGSAYGFYEKMGYEKVGTVHAGEDITRPMQVFRKSL